MGEVWSAEHVTLHRKVAVKVLLSHARQVPEIVARFKREALLLARTRSEHVPRAIDFTTDDTFGPVLVTELVEGQPLSDLLKTPLSVEEAIDVGIALATGIADLHRAHVVHRDLKPSNVILTRNADGARRAFIIDLGVSRWMKDEQELSDDPELSAITLGENVVGTLEYMPPEQLLQCRDVTAAADLYAIGAVLARAVLGRHIFGAIPDRVKLVKTKLTTDAPRLETGRDDSTALGLSAVVRRLLERDPENRYASAEALCDDLRALRVVEPPSRPMGTGAGTDAPSWRDIPTAPECFPSGAAPKPIVPPRLLVRPRPGRVVTAAMLLLVVLGVAVCSHQPVSAFAQPSATAAAPP
jgi:serine/threonine-protein kinase